MRYTWLTDTVTPNLDRALHYTLLWGLDAVELRTLGSGQDRVPFVNEEKLRRRLLDHDLGVSAVVPGLFEGPLSDRVTWLNDVAAFPEVAQFCTRIRCRTVLVSAFAEEAAPVPWSERADPLRRLGDVAATHNLTCAVLNEPDMAVRTGADLAALLAEVDHPNVHAAWQPATSVAAGEADVAAVVDMLCPSLTYVRCADADAEGQLVPFGEGVVDWDTIFAQLHHGAYTGPLSLLVEGTPVSTWGVRAATRLIKLDRAQRTAARPAT